MIGTRREQTLAIFTKSLSFACFLASGEKSKGVALGMQNGGIPNDDVTASYYVNHSSYLPHGARLFSTNTAWHSSYTDKNNFLLIDLGLQKTTVTRIATQGHYDDRHAHAVIQYYLSFSREGLFFHRYFEHNNPKVSQSMR